MIYKQAPVVLSQGDVIAEAMAALNGLQQTNITVLLSLSSPRQRQYYLLVLIPAVAIPVKICYCGTGKTALYYLLQSF